MPVNLSPLIDLPNTCPYIRALAVTVLIAAGCGTVEPFPVDESQALPELRGTVVSDVAFNISLLWTPNSDELLFVSYDGARGLAYRPTTHSVRTVAIPSSGYLSQLALSADSVEAFTLVSFPGVDGSTLRRHTTKETATITTTARFGFPNMLTEGMTVLASPIQPVIAYLTSPGILSVLRRGSAPAVVGTDCGGIIAFSPDESRVLCRTSGDGSFSTFRVDGGGRQRVDLPPDVEKFTVQALWAPDGIRLLYGRPAINLYDVTRQTSRAVVSGTADFLFHVFSIDVAAGGERLAFSIANCGKGDSMMCDLLQLTIYTVDLTTNAVTRQVVHSLPKDDLFLPRMAISPDGSHLVYAIDGRLYAVDLK